MKNDNDKLYIVAFVAIVAIMALAYMFNPNVCTGTRGSSTEDLTTFYDESGNMVGMARSVGALCNAMRGNSYFDYAGNDNTWFGENCGRSGDSSAAWSA